MTDPKTQDQETRDLPDLLREIAELAPEVITYLDRHQEVEVWLESNDPIAEDVFIHPAVNSKVGRAIIQAALQEAIEERGWDMFIQNIKTGEWHARIAFTGSNWHCGNAEDPATAIASAFLKALRAEQ